MVPSITCSEENLSDTIEFGLVGLVSTIEFQRCLAYIETLHKTYPKIYLKPFIRPMLEFDWSEYVTKMQRKIGKDFWHLKRNVVVFVNKEYLGDDNDLLSFVAKRLNIKLKRDYECLLNRGLLDIYQKYMDLGRKFIYLSIAKNHRVIGHLIFMLYADLVPKTCRRFVKKCKSKHGFKGTSIHRIMAASWIQFGDYTLPLKNHSCENYTIPHNRRGVLSMCNDGRNTHNTSQFIVCLNPTDWMDYRYVAFGQMVQGGEILKQIETQSTYFEHPEPDELIIANCGEITLDDTVKAKRLKGIDKYLRTREASGDLFLNIEDSRDSASILLEAHYLAGDYFFEDDNKPNRPMNNGQWLDETNTTISSVVSNLEMFEDEREHSIILQEILYDFPHLLNQMEASGEIDVKRNDESSISLVNKPAVNQRLVEYLKIISANQCIVEG